MERVGFKKLCLYPGAWETLLFEGAWTFSCPLLEKRHPYLPQEANSGQNKLLN